jgi:hypothetical protein
LVYTVQTLSKTLKKMETHLSLLTPPAQLPRAAPRLYPVTRALPCPAARAAPLPSRSHHALPSRSHRALPRLAAASTCLCLSRHAPTQPLSPRLAQPLTPRPAQAGRCCHLLVPLAPRPYPAALTTPCPGAHTVPCPGWPLLPLARASAILLALLPYRLLSPPPLPVAWQNL